MDEKQSTDGNLGEVAERVLLPLLKNWPEFTQSFLEASKVERTGLRRTEEVYPIHCSTEYHFARMTGRGSRFAPLLYNVALRIAGDGGLFMMSIQTLVPYLNVMKDEGLYAAASLLVESGLWEVAEHEAGKPKKYRVWNHESWSEKNDGVYCCKKAAPFPFTEPTRENAIGRILYAIMGEKFFPNVIEGWRRLVENDDQLITLAGDFMKEDLTKGSGVTRRKRFGEFLRARQKERQESEPRPRDLP